MMTKKKEEETQPADSDKQDPPVIPPAEGDKPGVKTSAKTQEEKKGFTLIEEANAAAERLERANEERRNLLDKEEKLQAQRTLGGRSYGNVPPKDDPLKDPVEYSKALMRGEVNPLNK